MALPITNEIKYFSFSNRKSLIAAFSDSKYKTLNKSYPRCQTPKKVINYFDDLIEKTVRKESGFEQITGYCEPKIISQTHLKKVSKCMSVV